MEAPVDQGLRQVGRALESVDLGYAATQVLRAAIDGTLKPGATSVKAGKLGELQIVNSGEVVLLGSPTVFTKDNINQFDF